MHRGKPVDKVIDDFGGTGAMAATFGVLSSAVSNWRAFGCFPARLHYRIAKEAERRGIDVPESLFGEPPHQSAAE